MYPSQRSGGEHPSSDYPPHRSPAQTPGQIYSPTENRNRSRVSSISGAPHSPQYNRGYPPSSPSASRVATGPPHSHDRTSSGYYDPTMEGRERVLDHAHPRIQPRSPVEPVRHPQILSLISCADMLQPHPPHLSGDRYGEPNGHRLDASHSLSHQPIVADARDEPFLTQRSPPNVRRLSNFEVKTDNSYSPHARVTRCPCRISCPTLDHQNLHQLQSLLLSHRLLRLCLGPHLYLHLRPRLHRRPLLLFHFRLQKPAARHRKQPIVHSHRTR